MSEAGDSPQGQKDVAMALQWICFALSFVSFGFYGYKVSRRSRQRRPRRRFYAVFRLYL